jgi:hypothetical protein
VSDPDTGEHVRRLAAVMRFLTQMHGFGTEADLIQAVIQAAAVWYDLDVRAYRRDLRSVDRLDTWLPGADLDADPRELTTGALVSPDQAARISSMADFEQLGWRNAQREVALVPISPGGAVRWLLVVPGAVDRDTEATLMLVCRTAASVLEQLASRKARELTEHLTAVLAQANGSVAPVADALLGGLMAATGAVRGTLAIRRAEADKRVALAARGDVGLAGSRPADLEAGQVVFEPGRIAIAERLGGGADALIELGAGPTAEFSTAAASLAEAGALVIRSWLAGVALADRRAAVSERPEESSAPPVEKPAGADAGPTRRLALKGGVVVMSIEERGAAGDIEARRALMDALKAEIRSVDLLGQLATGEFAALLVRASESGTRSAERRLRQRIDRLSRERGLPKVALASALYPPATGETLVMLAGRALAAARGAGEPRFFG